MVNLQHLDPRVMEAREIRRREFYRALSESYANREHTIAWALVVFVIIWATLTPFRGVTEATLFASAASLLWAAVHKTRRV